MKISKVYEVWVGGDMVGDDLTLDQARLLAREEFERELKEAEPVDVVVDEHSYIEIESLEDLDSVGSVRVTHFGSDYGKVEANGVEYEVPLGLAKALSSV